MTRDGFAMGFGFDGWHKRESLKFSVFSFQFGILVVGSPSPLPSGEGTVFVCWFEIWTSPRGRQVRIGDAVGDRFAARALSDQMFDGWFCGVLWRS